MTIQYETKPLDIVGGSTFGRYSKISLAQTWNMMISDNALVNYPGYELSTPLATGGTGRELYTSTKLGKMFAIISDQLYLVDDDLSVAALGKPLATSSGNAFIAENDNNQIAIVDGLNLYTYNYFTDQFTTQTSTDLGFSPVYIAFQDGYFIACGPTIVTKPNPPITNQWFLSDPGTTNFPLNTNAAGTVGLLQTKPDSTVAVVPLNRQLFVFGNTVGEPWYNAGYNLFPYQRNNSYCFNYGCLSSTTIATNDDFVVWLGANEESGPVIMYSDGGLPKSISTDGIDFELSELHDPTNSYAFLFKQDGHLFYQISFVDPRDNYTLAYDFNMDKFYNLSDQNYNYHIAKRVAFFNNNYYFVSFNDANLYQLGSEFTTYNNIIIPRVRICSPIRKPDASWFILNNINITMEQGETKGESRLDLSISRDGGATFTNNIPHELNRLGKRQNKCQFWRMGAANDATVQLRWWTPGRVVALGATASIYQ